uniref:Uncharacterized protein n=1 Tax=Paramoeba aestuarina TaxID=180227 RepID=A0A7S4KWQ5_9EUKA
MAESTAQLLYVGGMQSSSGKSTCCLAILSFLLEHGYSPSDLAYIKPVTQCESLQPVTQFCHTHGIRHIDAGPVVFRSGVTYKFIEDNDPEAGKKRIERVVKAVHALAKGKKFVLVDGIGYASVGSNGSVSNAQIAKALNAPVLLVGKTGVGDAIDSMNLSRIYFHHYGCDVVGAIFSKVKLDCPRHTYDNCKKFVSMYFEKGHEDGAAEERKEPPLKVFGFVPTNKDLVREVEESCALMYPNDEIEGCCSRDDFEVSEEDKEWNRKAVKHFEEFIDFQALFGALKVDLK